MNDQARPHYFGKDLEAMSVVNNYHRWILSEMAPYLGTSVAEVGAGSGTFTRLLLETALKQLHAFEPSNNMFELLNDAVHHDARAIAINDYFEARSFENTFDSVLYINVLEHIEDDAHELAVAHKALNATGTLLVFVPALPCLYSEFDRQIGHYRRYVKKDLVRLVERAGFNVIKARYFDVVGILPWYICFTLLKRSMQGANVALYDKVVVPVMRPLERVITPWIGKNILLIARKQS